MMIVDLRAPTIIIAGAFNPAIFDPAWMANALYNIPEGQDVGGIFVTDLIQQSTRPYIGNIALVAEPHRLSVFCDDLNDETFASAEAIICKVADVLPHTPVGGLGVNFQVICDNLEPHIIDMLGARDRPEKLGPVLQTEITSMIDLTDGLALNLARNIQNGTLRVRFNYHTGLDRMSDVAEKVRGNVRGFYDQALSAMGEMYGIDADEIEFQKALNN